MIHFFRQYQSSVGRSLLSLLLGVWLSLALAPCVMAMTAADMQMGADTQTGYHELDLADKSDGCHACHSDETCVSKSDLPLAGFVEPVIYAENSFILVTALALPGLPVPEPPRSVSAYLLPDPGLIKQHPSLKFRVLRI